MGGTVLLFQTPAHVQLAGLGNSVREVLYIQLKKILLLNSYFLNLKVIIHFTHCNTPIEKMRGAYLSRTLIACIPKHFMHTFAQI